MAPIRWDPFRDILFLQERMSRIFDEALVRYKGSGSLQGCGWSPPVDIYETEENIVLKAEVPGLEIKDVSIEVDDNTLVLKGERKLQKNPAEENYHRMERCYGSFNRVFSLPNVVDKDHIRANLREGVLEITVPKITEPGRESIKVAVE